MDIHKIKTLGQLQASGYQPKSIKQELRNNLVKALRNNEEVFSGIIGYDDTVIPDLQRAILSKHNINLLGLRGQAKTRLARLMVNLLDEYIPVIEGSEVMDDPMAPISNFGQTTVEEKGDKTPIHWVHRDERYAEKLATPDVSIADLIGDIDPIKAASKKLSYSDEGVIHFGMVPRSNRCIFVINELPDLQPRIQVALFNILQEGDIQIRGFKLRMPLDIQFVFTANPEDYTNRGSIVTPLKDRIGSQILTHYPKDIETAAKITAQEAKLTEEQSEKIYVPERAMHILEQIGFQARESEFIDEKSGVSARLSITSFENLISAAERRMIVNNAEKTTVRVSDFVGVIPAITGKVELVYEGEQEGAYVVAENLIGEACEKQFEEVFPRVNQLRQKDEENPFLKILVWFGKGNSVELLLDDPDEAYRAALDSVEGLGTLVDKFAPDLKPEDRYFHMELVLNALAESSKLGKEIVDRGVQFEDLLSSMLSDDEDDEL
jgi:magnesium chelatase subunit I